MGISDLELVDAIRKGEIIAFQELYKRYADLMYRNILVRVNSSFDADDIFQDFFIKLWEKRANFKIESNVKVYLLVALKHHILNTIKERQIRLKYQEASGQALIEEDDYTWVKIVSEDLSVRMREVVDTFPPRLKNIYILSRERHLSVKEIAEKLNEKVAEGMINISMNTAPYFEDGKAEGNVMIVNESINNYPQQVEFIRNDTGEQIYQSKAIPVGSKIERAALDVELPAGTYECTAMFHNLDPETGDIIGTAGAIITITIKN